MDDETRNALIAYTGNDYASFFFRRGKQRCFDVLQKYPKFKQAFIELGTNWELSEYLISALEEFTCYIYGSRTKDIDNLRYKMFNKKYVKENKIIDMSLLPPCRSVLTLHIKRANFVAAMWK